MMTAGEFAENFSVIFTVARFICYFLNFLSTSFSCRIKMFIVHELRRAYRKMISGIQRREPAGTKHC